MVHSSGGDIDAPAPAPEVGSDGAPAGGAAAAAPPAAVASPAAAAAQTYGRWIPSTTVEFTVEHQEKVHNSGRLAAFVAGALKPYAFVEDAAPPVPQDADATSTAGLVANHSATAVSIGLQAAGFL